MGRTAAAAAARSAAAAARFLLRFALRSIDEILQETIAVKGRVVFVVTQIAQGHAETYLRFERIHHCCEPLPTGE